MIKPKPHLTKLSPYPPGKTEEEVRRELGITGKIYKMNSNENPLGPSRAVIGAIQKAASQVHRYPEASYIELKKAIAQRHGISEKQVIVGNGSDEVLEFVFKAFLEPEDCIVISSPSFLMYEKFAEIYNVGVEKVPLSQDFRHNLSKIKKLLLSRAKVAFFDHPHNPTGTVLSKKEWREFFNGLSEDVLVVIDEAYGDFVEDKDVPVAEEFFEYFPSLLVVRTFSKSLGLAGLRLGYGIASKEIATALEKVRQPFNINLLAVKAGLAVFEDKQYIEKSKRLVFEGRAYLSKELQKLGFKVLPSQANFVMVDFGENAEKIYQALLKKGILIRPLSAYGFKTWFRISIGLPEENRYLIEVVSSLL